MRFFVIWKSQFQLKAATIEEENTFKEGKQSEPLPQLKAALVLTNLCIYFIFVL